MTSGSALGAVVRRPALVGPGWPLSAFFGGYVALWALGLSNFALPALAVPMLAWLSRRPRVRIPPGAGLYGLFVAWMLTSALVLQEAADLMVFAYRASLYVAAGVVLVYVYNLPRPVVPAGRLSRWVARLWIAAAALGCAAIVAPTASFTSPLELAMPAGLVGNEWIHDLVHPHLSEPSNFLGYDVGRPAAPFVYTNNWGSVLALSTPFLVLAWLREPGRRRLAGVGLLAVAAVPVVYSLNRGLWLSLAVGLVYAGVRLAAARRLGALLGLAAAVLAGSLLLALSPLGEVVADRLATPHSNEDRLSLYTETSLRVREAPLLGYGTPQDSATSTGLPSVGTQGQLWMVLFSHGVPGAVLFVGWLLSALWRTRRVGDPWAFWCHVTLLIALVQLPVYGFLPTSLAIVVVAAGLGARENDALAVPPTRERSRPALVG
ncbi:MAG: hypothetical protein KY434_02605 [Actinobacteria bacterium]|nr:hypothetical protein [Actinomycetota bacterium]